MAFYNTFEAYVSSFRDGGPSVGHGVQWPMRVHIAVTPNARREVFEKTADTAFVAKVKKPASRNQANARVRELLASHFGVSLSSIRFVTGMRGKKKVFDVIV